MSNSSGSSGYVSFGDSGEHTRNNMNRWHQPPDDDDDDRDEEGEREEEEEEVEAEMATLRLDDSEPASTATSLSTTTTSTTTPPSLSRFMGENNSGRWQWPNGTCSLVLVVKKYRDEEISEYTRDLVLWLIRERKVRVALETAVLQEECFAHCVELNDYRRPGGEVEGKEDSSQQQQQQQQLLVEWNVEDHTLPIDLIISLGGDGTVLYVASLFQQRTVPIILSFHLGSFGFLTVFDYEDRKRTIERVISGENLVVNWRMRLCCSLLQHPLQDSPQPHTPGSGDDGTGGESEIESPVPPSAAKQLLQRTASGSSCSKEFHVLNEVVIDRGTSPYMTHLQMYVDDQRITASHADGIIVATPTGSTAYSLSAGGSIVHPSVPCILVTPICPHTLSFRPLLLPASAQLRIVNPLSSRTRAMVSFDGKHRVELRRGDQVIIKASLSPVPTVVNETQSRDWFDSLSRCLNWNSRDVPKEFSYDSRPSSAASSRQGTMKRNRSRSRLGIP